MVSGYEGRRNDAKGCPVRLGLLGSSRRCGSFSGFQVLAGAFPLRVFALLQVACFPSFDLFDGALML